MLGVLRYVKVLCERCGTQSRVRNALVMTIQSASNGRERRREQGTKTLI